MQAVLREMNCKTREHSWPDFWYFKDERRLKPATMQVMQSGTVKLLLHVCNALFPAVCILPFNNARVQDADVDAVLDRFSNIGNEAQPEVDVSAEQWLRSNGASERMISIADACIANDFGCSIDQLGLREAIIENQKWDVGS